MYRILLLISVVAIACGCNAPVDAVEGGATSRPVYQVISGACGRVVFDEKLGADYASAYAMIEARKVAESERLCPDTSCQTIKLESFLLEVADVEGFPPAAEFYGVRVLDQGKGTHLRSVSEVINTNGELFHLEWCPD